MFTFLNSPESRLLTWPMFSMLGLRLGQQCLNGVLGQVSSESI